MAPCLRGKAELLWNPFLQGLREEPRERPWLYLLPRPTLLSSAASKGRVSPHPEEGAASSSLPSPSCLPLSAFVIQETVVFPPKSSKLSFLLSPTHTLYFPFQHSLSSKRV